MHQTARGRSVHRVEIESHSERRDTCCERFESKRRSIEFSSVASGCKDDKRRERCRVASEPRSGSFNEHAEMRCGRSVNRRYGLGVAKRLTRSLMPQNFTVKRFTDAYDRKWGKTLNDLDTSSMIWGMFMSTTLEAAVHLGTDYWQNFSNYSTCVKN